MDMSVEELRLLEETAEAIFAAHAGEEPEAGGCSPGLWNALEESGLTLLGVDEEAGGSGGGLAEAAAVLRLAGAAAVPVPLAETAWLAAPALAAAGLTIPEGPLTAAIPPLAASQATGTSPAPGAASAPGATAAPGASAAVGVGAAAVADGDGWVVSGVLTRVPWARGAEGIVVLAEAEDALVTALVDPADAVITQGHNLAGEPRDTVELRGVRAKAAALGGLAAGELRRRAALARAVQLSGATAGALRLTLRYTSERVQFGRPLAKFQAIQHRLSEMAGETALTDIAVRAAIAATERADAPATERVSAERADTPAAERADSGATAAIEPAGAVGIAAGAAGAGGVGRRGGGSLAGKAEVAVAAAKSQASVAAGRVASAAHQLHGAIGATHEHELRHTTLRLWSWREEAGAEAPWNEELGARAIAATSLWGLITGTE